MAKKITTEFIDNPDKLLSKANNTQIKNFLKKLLFESAQMRDDFAVYLQGPKETSLTVLSYQEKIEYELDNLDLEDLYEAWQYSGEDYYDGYCRESEYDEESVSAIAEPYFEKAKKYLESKNYSECLKIYQAVIGTFLDKEKEVSEEYADLSEWFIYEVKKALEFITVVLKDSEEQKIKKQGIEYFCYLFEEYGSVIGQKNIHNELDQVVTTKVLAEIALESINKTKGLEKLESAESSLLAHLYFLLGDYEKFEKISLENFLSNLPLVLNLLKFYKRENRKNDILKIARRALEKLTLKFSSDSYFSGGDSRNLEIEIRKFLKTVFNLKDEYKEIVKNLESLFFISGELQDYKELVKIYKQEFEKEEFLERMEKYFTAQYNIKIIFKVFKIEDKKEKILQLINKHKEEHIFPEMIATIAKSYPKECFENYKVKIQNLLKDANVKNYPQAAYHLKQMENIDEDEEFKNFINWLRSFYSRRFRFIEELNKQGLR